MNNTLLLSHCRRSLNNNGYFYQKCARFSTIGSFIILLSFLGYYAIPPLNDFNAHIALGMIHGRLFEYYQYQPALTYRLFDTLIRFWNFLFRDHYVAVASFTYISSISLMFSVTYNFSRLLGNGMQRSLYLLAFLIGPFFLLLHSLQFIVGIIPFILASFMVIGSSMALWCLDREIATNTLKKKTLALFFVYTLLAIYAHPAAFLYLGLSWIIPGVHYFFFSTYRWRRFFFFLCLFVLLIAGAFFTTHHLGGKQFSQELNVSFHPLERLYWLFNGNIYVFAHRSMFPLHMKYIVGATIYRQLLAIMPFIVEGILVYVLCKKKNKEHWLIFITAQLGLQLALVFVLPERLGECRDLYQRHWIFVTGWTFLGMAYLFNQVNETMFQKLCCFSFLITAIFCYNLMPLYADFRQKPIEEVAAHATPLLINAVNRYREQHPEYANKTIVIEPQYHVLGKGGYDFAPFIVMLSPELLKNNIVIRDGWDYAEYLSVHWKKKSSTERVYVKWKRAPFSIAGTSDEIVLLPST